MPAAAERPRPPGQPRIERMFDGIVPHYDLLNRLMSLGMDRRWRRIALDALQLPAGIVVLDLGCGTGDLCRMLTGRGSWAVGMDVSWQMLKVAQRKLLGPRLVRGSAFRLPFKEGAFGGVVSGFVLRNLDDLDSAFRELARVLPPAGQLALLDATEPPNPLVRALFDAYFRLAAPALGGIFGQRRAYTYLVGSLAHLPPNEEMRRLLTVAGFEDVRAQPLDFGAVTLYTGQKR